MQFLTTCCNKQISTYGWIDNFFLSEMCGNLLKAIPIHKDIQVENLVLWDPHNPKHCSLISPGIRTWGTNSYWIWELFFGDKVRHLNKVHHLDNVMILDKWGSKDFRGSSLVGNEVLWTLCARWACKVGQKIYKLIILRECTNLYNYKLCEGEGARMLTYMLFQIQSLLLSLERTINPT